ncbi:50S ribosomal protein L11 [Candidatus Pacearchaeota archaeon]|nr:50S ribosomal protein L11 [Candidatus Pacearchaeota archaeon]
MKKLKKKKFQNKNTMQIKVLTEGGSMKPGPALSQKLGPAGINMGQVISKINEATKSFAGLKVPVELDIDTAAKTFSVKVFSPPVSELLKKELKIDKGSNAQKKIRVANASIEQIISVAKTKMPNMLSKNLKSAVKSVVGTCISLGTLIENKSAKEIIEDINAGIYDEEIQAEKTETSSDKRKKLDQYFSEVKAEQEKILQQEQAAKEAAEAAAAVKPEEGAEAKKEEVPKEEKKEKEPSKK